MPRWFVLIAVAASLVLQALTASGALANGGTVEIFQGQAGPYIISVRSNPAPPAVGNVHLSIAFTTPGKRNQGTITNATVQIAAQGPQGSDALGPLLLQRPFGIYYDANLLFSQAGQWVLTIAISGSEGDATLEVPLEVSEAPPFNPALAGILTLAALFALGYGVWLVRSHHQPPSKERR